MRLFLTLLILFSLGSCGKTTTQKVEEAIDIAMTYLTDEECQKAIDLLESLGRQKEDPIYIQVLASAYACRGGFRTIAFVANDLLALSTGATLMTSLSILSLSTETTSDSSNYTDIRTALDLLLEPETGGVPSQVTRQTRFGSRKSGDIGVNILFLSIVQMGKFLNHFGNVSAAGAKGLGSGTNTCLMDYSYANAQAVVAAFPAANNCNANNAGKADLLLSTTAGRRRACEGLMLLTNLLDVSNNIDVSRSPGISKLEDVATAVTSLRTTAVTADPSLSTLLNMTSQSLCETRLSSASERNNMELIYALIFEAGLP